MQAPNPWRWRPILFPTYNHSQMCEQSNTGRAEPPGGWMEGGGGGRVKCRTWGGFDVADGGVEGLTSAAEKNKDRNGHEGCRQTQSPFRWRRRLAWAHRVRRCRRRDDRDEDQGHEGDDVRWGAATAGREDAWRVDPSHERPWRSGARVWQQIVAGSLAPGELSTLAFYSCQAMGVELHSLG
jgi:hypothetical protein